MGNNGNFIGNAFVGVTQGLAQGLQNQYAMNRQTITDRAQLQKMADDQQYRSQTMDMQQKQFEQNTKEWEQKMKEFDMKFAYLEQSSAFDAYSADGDVSHLNRLLQKSPMTKDRAGVVRFDKLNANEPADLNMLQQQYGLTEITPAVEKNYVKGTRPDGSTVIMPMNGLYIATGYASSKDKETRAKLMQDAELAQKQAETKKDIAQAGYFERDKGKEGNDLLKTLQAQKLLMEMENMKLEEVGTNNPELLGKLVMNGDSVVKVGDKEVPVAKIAKATQGKSELSSTDRTFMDGLYDAASSFKVLQTKLGSDKYDRDALSKLQKDFTAVVTTDWKSITPEQRTKILDGMGLDSEIKTAMAAYIKAMSGAAVSDEERKFYVDTITKGDWSTKEAAMSTMGGFVNGITRSYENKLDSLKNFVPYEVLTRTNQLKKLKTPETSSQTKEAPKQNLTPHAQTTEQPSTPTVGSKVKVGNGEGEVVGVNGNVYSIKLPTGEVKQFKWGN